MRAKRAGWRRSQHGDDCSTLALLLRWLLLQLLTLLLLVGGRKGIQGVWGGGLGVGLALFVWGV